VDSQQRYDQVTSGTRFTLSAAFRKAGWRTLSDVPSDSKPWPVGTSFYHYEQELNATNVGYRGPTFSYAQVPDQYSLAYFQQHELSEPHQPLMAEIDLVSSHTPWTPLPKLLPWDQLGDGSVYDPQPAEGLPPSVVWQDPHHVQQVYGQSIEYTMSSLTSFLTTFDDPNLVLVVLGDHQPATIVSGPGGEPRRPDQHHREGPGRHPADRVVGVAARAAAVRRRPRLAHGRLPEPLPDGVRAVTLTPRAKQGTTAAPPG
jgi:hypothetical protein